MSSPTPRAARVFPRLYRDSVALMALASQVERRDGVHRVGAVMATPANLGILERSGMLPDDLTAAPDDLVIVVRAADEEALAAALDEAEAGLTTVEQAGGPRAEVRPATVAEGLAVDPDLTLAAISTPGTHAPVVAEQALRRGLHVFCFSDNVPVDDEVRLKQLAVERGLLLMGPDCGTAVIDGVPLGFANVTRPGPVAVVAASGTGAQEVACLLDGAGVGLSQLVGVGGRDLSAQVGGLMTHHALDLVTADPATEVVLVVSKPPSPGVADRLLERLAGLGKPAVACLLGAEDDGDLPAAGASAGVLVRGTLEGGAMAAAALAGHPFTVTDQPVIADGPLPDGVLGLYTGGTLASEAQVILSRAGVRAEIVDLGADEYTAGRPHPMIDPSTRAEAVAEAGRRADVGVLLVDLVLGHGSAADPATPVAEAVRTAVDAARADGRHLMVLGSVTGTASDPQPIDRQREILTAAGVHVLATNAAAARAAAALVRREENA